MSIRHMQHTSEGQTAACPLGLPQPIHGLGVATLAETGGGTLLLISEDTRFCEALQRFSEADDRKIVTVKRLAAALLILHKLRPRAILLDLDLPGNMAWTIADGLLSDPACPPILLVTDHTEQFDVDKALRAGSVAAKSEQPARLLEFVAETLTRRATNAAEQNAIQRILIHWLKPSSWSAPVTPAHRFWGINE